MPVDPSELSRAARARYYTANLFMSGAIGLIGLIPYRWRVPAMGWLTAHVLAPLAGFRKRVRNNLALARPDLGPAEVERLVRAVPDNAGRMMIELYAGAEFRARAAQATISGPGLEALREAQAQKRPVILMTGHFGNYLAARARLEAEGFAVGSLYRRMANPYFSETYVGAMADGGHAMYEQGRRGMIEMVRDLKAGGIIAIVGDLHAHGGRELRFFGQPAVTSVVPAELALKYGAALIPTYAIRQPNGLDFHIEMHEPIPPGDPETMTQAVNDGLEELVRRHMDQWFWIHRRWKPWGGLGLQSQAVE